MKISVPPLTVYATTILTLQKETVTLHEEHIEFWLSFTYKVVREMHPRLMLKTTQNILAND